jgi:hypothetical protein
VQTGRQVAAKVYARLSHCVMSKYFIFSPPGEWMNKKTEVSEILYSPTIRSVCARAHAGQNTHIGQQRSQPDTAKALSSRRHALTNASWTAGVCKRTRLLQLTRQADE